MKYVIEVTQRGQQKFVCGKEPRFAPVLTSDIDRAMQFDSMAKCKYIRDDVLQWCSNQVNIIKV